MEDLFQEAADLDPDRRGALLDERCAGDPGLRAAVEELLAYDAKVRAATDFLRSPAAEFGAALWATNRDVPASLGPMPLNEP